MSSYDIATVYAALGDTEASLRWLERALEMMFVDVDPAFDGLRENAQFQRIVSAFPDRMRRLVGDELARVRMGRWIRSQADPCVSQSRKSSSGRAIRLRPKGQ